MTSGRGRAAGIKMAVNHGPKLNFALSREHFIASSAAAILGCSQIASPFPSFADQIIFAEDKYKVTSKCFFDLSIEGKPAGRIVISLFGEEAPQTCANFRALVEGRPGYGYRGERAYRVIQDFSVQIGSIGDKTGRSGKSSFDGGAPFGPENFNIPHTDAGLVSMARGLDGKTDSRFFIQTQGDAGWADGKYVAFGKVTEGFTVVQEIEKLKTQPPQNNPTKKVVIEDCGVL
uniref:Peptidyl-prolyl cis-trans isomerase n=1 Tax=Heterosigma akashiwo TaxID=2829 RepID=A0A6V1WNP3_HETAK